MVLFSFDGYNNQCRECLGYVFIVNDNTAAIMYMI